MSHSRAAVIGTRIDALLAAYAASLSGYEVNIIPHGDQHNLRQSRFGGHYIDMPIPGLDGIPSDAVYQHLYGSRDEFRAASGEEFWSPRNVDVAWDIRAVYNTLFMWALPRIDMALALHEEHIGTLVHLLDEYDRVISETPRSWWGFPDDVLRSTHSWIAEGEDIHAPCGLNTIICQGNGATGWFRATNLFSQKTIEWPSGSKPPIPNLHRRIIPRGSQLSDDANGIPNLLHVGELGAWSPGYRPSDSFRDALEFLS